MGVKLRVRRLHAMGLHGDGREQFVVAVENHVEHVAAPIAEAVAAVVPPRAPDDGGDAGAVGSCLAQAQSQRFQSRLAGGWLGSLDVAVEIEIFAVVRRADPDVGFDGLAEHAAAQDFHGGAATG